MIRVLLGPPFNITIFIWFKTLIRSVRVIARKRLINCPVPHRSSMLSLNDGVAWLQRLQRRPIKCPGKRLGSWKGLGFTNDMNRLTGATVEREREIFTSQTEKIYKSHLNCVAWLTMILGGPLSFTRLVWLIDGKPGTAA